MNKKFLAPLAGLAVAGGIFASAATLGGVTTTGMGASTAVVASCDTDGVTLAYTTAYDATTGTYRVSTVSVSGIAPACSGKNISVSLRNAAGTSSVSSTPTAVASTTAALSVSPTFDAAAVDNATVLIAG